MHERHGPHAPAPDVDDLQWAGLKGRQGLARGQEYNLDLPGSGNGSPTETSPADADSSNSGGFPVIVVVLVAGAGLAAGVAAWRMRKPGGPSESA